MRIVTDTAGTSYNAAAGTAVLVGVNSTAASVNTAIANIANGTLTGLVPGAGLITNLAAANTAVDAYAKQVAVSNPTFDNTAGVKDGSVTSVEATAALATATTARFDTTKGGVSANTTVTLTANVTNAVDAAAVSKALVVAATGGLTAITAYDNAATALNTLQGTVATQDAAAVAKASAEAGLTAAFASTGATVSLLTLGTVGGLKDAAVPPAPKAFADAAAVTAFLADPTTNVLLRAAVVTELNKVTTYGPAVVAAGDKALAIAKAGTVLDNAKTALELVDTDSVTAGVQKTDYVAKAQAVTDTNELLTKAKAADVKVAEAKVVVDQYTILNKSAADATKAIGDFALANATKVNLTAITGVAVANPALTADAAKSDVFYFSTKVNTANDVAINSFGAGDSIVLGSGYTQGTTLATGNSSALEFFLVKGATGTQVVIENAAYGNASTTVAADGTVSASPDATVINLVGVTADHLSVANGVVSYV